VILTRISRDSAKVVITKSNHKFMAEGKDWAEEWNARKEAAVGSGNEDEIAAIRNIEGKVSGVEATITHIGWGAGLKNADLKAIHESGKQRVLKSIQELRDTGVETVHGEDTEAWIRGRVHSMAETYRALVERYSDPKGPRINNQEGEIAGDKASLEILEDVERELGAAA
jgi:CRISPR/Cas system CSM-associated protein Csm5 (group 7 of RAMP superfamily)